MERHCVSDLEASKILGMSPQSLRNARCTKRGALATLPYVKIGRRILYLLPDLEKFLAERRIDPQALHEAG